MAIASTPGFGLFPRLRRKVGARGRAGGRTGWEALSAVVALLSPLLLLAALQGLLRGFPGALLVDVGVWVRFAFAVPLLIGLLPVVAAVHEHALSLLVGAEVLDPEVAGRLKDRFRVQATTPASQLAVFLLALVFSMISSQRYLGETQATWHVVPGASGMRLSWAGWWNMLVATPVAMALILGWVRRMVLWGRLLAAAAPSLRLHAVHPDRVGGLGPLVRYHVLFAGVLLALSSFIAGGAWMELALAGKRAMQLLWAVVPIIVVLTLLYLGPLLVLTPTLLRTRRLGLDRYGVLASHFSQRFDDALLESGGIGRRLLDEEAFSAHADMGSSHERVQRMRMVPVDLRVLVAGVIGAGVPLLLVLARDVVFAVELESFAKTAVKLLLP